VITPTTRSGLTVNAAAQPNYSLSASPSSVTLTQGNSWREHITISPTNGFTGSVQLAGYLRLAEVALPRRSSRQHTTSRAPLMTLRQAARQTKREEKRTGHLRDVGQFVSHDHGQLNREMLRQSPSSVQVFPLLYLFRLSQSLYAPTLRLSSFPTSDRPTAYADHRPAFCDDPQRGIVGGARHSYPQTASPGA